MTYYPQFEYTHLDGTGVVERFDSTSDKDATGEVAVVSKIMPINYTASGALLEERDDRGLPHVPAARQRARRAVRQVHHGDRPQLPRHGPAPVPLLGVHEGLRAERS